MYLNSEVLRSSKQIPNRFFSKLEEIKTKRSLLSLFICDCHGGIQLSLEKAGEWWLFVWVEGERQGWCFGFRSLTYYLLMILVFAENTKHEHEECTRIHGRHRSGACSVNVA